MRVGSCQNRDGFSLVEVIVAMLVLTVGILAIAATTGHVFTRINDAGRRTERAFAIQQVVDSLRSRPFTSIDHGGTPANVGAFTISVRLADETVRLKKIEIVTEGPGYRLGRPVADLTDTTYITISRGGT